jgi:hypothetical protein
VEGKRPPSAQGLMGIKVCEIGGSGRNLCQLHFLVFCGRKWPPHAEIDDDLPSTNSGPLLRLNKFNDWRQTSAFSLK